MPLVTKDGRFDFRQWQPEVGVVRAERFKQCGSHSGEKLPVVGKGIDVALRNTALQVAVDILNVFWFSAVDVTREVEVEVVFRVGNLQERGSGNGEFNMDAPFVSIILFVCVSSHDLFSSETKMHTPKWKER